MNDRFTKVILIGILIRLMIIAFKPIKEDIAMPSANINIDNMRQIVKIAPNRIGIVDSCIHAGYRG